MAYRWNPRVATRTYDGTAFILLDSRMVSLNEVGSRIWELCRDGAELDEVGRMIAQEFETTEDVARRDAEQFVTDLVARDMLLTEDASRAEGGSHEA